MLPAHVVHIVAASGRENEREVVERDAGSRVRYAGVVRDVAGEDVRLSRLGEKRLADRRGPRRTHQVDTLCPLARRVLPADIIDVDRSLADPPAGDSVAAEGERVGIERLP